MSAGAPNTQLAGHDNLSLDFVHRDHPSSPDVLRGKLRAAGLQSVLPLVTEPWGQRRCQVAAPDGLVVEVLQTVEPYPQWLAEHGLTQ